MSCDIATNDLVNDNEDCMVLVKDALKLIDSEDFYHLSVTTRRSLASSALVVRIREYHNQKDHILCYHGLARQSGFMARFYPLMIPER